jgi:acyl-CoA reductase-like NAD-dependent aldehyde dehydrogenase
MTATTTPITADAMRARYATPLPMLIDGAWVPGASSETLDVLEPARGETLACVHAAGPPEVDRAVRAARRTLSDPAWARMAPAERSRILWRIGDLLEAHADELGLLETLNNGKTLREGKDDVLTSADCFRFYAGCARQVLGETIPVDSGDLVYTVREPVGVCGQIVPWNYPLLMASWKVAPALACGCTVVLKPSEWTPLTALELGRLCLEAGVPAGAVHVVPGLGPVAGDALARHADVDKVAFTGSVATARKLLHASAESNMKRLSLELGGKSPIVVMPDADLDKVVEAAFWGIFANKGEICSASSRLLAHASVKDRLVAALAARARSMRVGDPLDPATEMGALVSRPQLDKVMRYIERGKAQGARVAAGGERFTDEPRARGLFVAPTVFDCVEPAMDIAREEIFGPVLSVLGFQDDAEAVRVANGTSYGLVAAVFTRDVSRAHRVARALQAGVVWINRWNGFDHAAPFGGVKESGWGRELGRQVLDLYTQTKCVWVRV